MIRRVLNLYLAYRTCFAQGQDIVGSQIARLPVCMVFSSSKIEGRVAWFAKGLEVDERPSEGRVMRRRNTSVSCIALIRSATQ